MNGTATRKATTPQFDLIRILLIELGEISPLGVEMADLTRTLLNEQRAAGTFDFYAARRAIDAIKNAKGRVRAELAKNAPAPAAKARVEIPEVPAGSYALEIEGVLKFYVVEVSKTGFVTAYAQASDELHKLPFRAMVAVLAQIVEVTPLEASKAYGRAIGVCGKCGRTLTDANSRAAGIGPVCAGKL